MLINMMCLTKMRAIVMVCIYWCFVGKSFGFHMHRRKHICNYYRSDSITTNRNHRFYDQYAVSRSLKLLSAESQVEDDGYSTYRYGARPNNIFGKLFRLMRQIISYIFGIVLKKPTPGTLILVRHGESTWNFNSTYVVFNFYSYELNFHYIHYKYIDLSFTRHFLNNR